MKPIQRHITPEVFSHLDAFPAVYINGPRQAGKTTLARTLLGKRFDGTFITFDDVLERATASQNPQGYLRDLGYPLVIDEVQMVPEIFRPIKMLVDEQRYKVLMAKKKQAANGHYLLTGSANLLVIPALADAMVGRMGTVTLLPFSAGEVMGKKPKFIERCFTKDFSGIKADKNALIEMMQKATFPELSTMKPTLTTDWFRNYVQKITLEDPRQIYNLEKATYMPVLLQLLAARAGNLVNDADIARDAGLNAITTRTYRNLLMGTFVTHYLHPWYRNTTKRLVKSSKIYFYDTMLLCHVLGTTPATLAKAQPQRFGHILENFVLTELMKMNHANTDQVAMSFYRTRDDKEVDFVLERGRKLVGIEVKNAENIGTKELAGLRELRQEAKDEFLCGIVLCNTARVMEVDKNIYLVPFSALWQ
jgi:uncharacterized protein